jgi:hypothetical protein
MWEGRQVRDIDQASGLRQGQESWLIAPIAASLHLLCPHRSSPLPRLGDRVEMGSPDLHSFLQLIDL